MAERPSSSAQRAPNLERMAHVVLAVACVAVAATWPLGLSVNIQDHDEGDYAEGAREMVEQGDLSDPRCNYVPWYGHPALSMWVIGIAFRLLGVSSTVARLPAIPEAILIVLMTYALGRRLFGRAEGALAAALCVSLPALTLMGHNVKTDMNLILFTTAAILLGHMALERPWLYVVAGASAGLAMLTKGLFGAAMPFIVLLCTWAWERRWRQLSGQLGYMAAGVAACVAVWLPWNWVMYQRYGQMFIDVLYLSGTFQRFGGPTHTDPGPPFYFPITLLWAAGPAVPGLLLGLLLRLADLRGRWRQAPPWPVLDLVWLVVPTVVMSMSSNKLPHYIFPVLPGLCALSAHALVRAMRGDVAPVLGVMMRWGTLFMCVVATGFALAMITVCFPPPEGLTLLVTWLVFVAALVPLAWRLIAGSPFALVLTPCLAAILAMSLHNGAVRPELIRYQVAPMIAAVLDNDRAPRGTTSPLLGLTDNDRVGISFYGRIRVEDAELSNMGNTVGPNIRYVIARPADLPELWRQGLVTRVRGHALSFRTSLLSLPFSFVDNHREFQAYDVLLVQVWRRTTSG